MKGIRAPRAVREWLPTYGDEKGIVLFGVLLLISTLLTLGIVGVRGSNVELKIAGNDLRAQKALNFAEAGIHHTVALMSAGNGQFNDELENTGTGGDLIGLGGTAALAGVTHRFRHLGIDASDGYYVRAADNLDETSGANDPANDRDRTVRLISVGRALGAERVIEAMARLTGGGFGGFYGRDEIKTSGGAKVDSYDSSLGPYGGANVAQQAKVWTNGDVTMSSSSGYVHGDVSAGGTVDIAGTVTGAVTEGADPVNFDPVPPCGPPYSSGAGITGVGFSYDAATGQLTSGSDVVFANGTYCLGKVSLTGGAALVVNGPVALYSTGEIKSTGGGVLNNTHLPSNLKIFVSGSDGVTLTGGPGAYAEVYAPDSVVNYTGGADFFGSIIGAKIINTGGGTLHADSSLNGGATVTLFGMREVRNF